MSTGKLKAQYNRVRTSVALQANSMWTKTIGLVQDSQAGSNAVIEASLKAPTHGGRGREARREAAKALIEEAGYEPAVTSFEGLVALARAQGSIGGTNRGACKMCGGMGHLTKQCKNHLSTFYNKGDGTSGSGELGLPLVREDSEISSLSSDVSSDASSAGESSSSVERVLKKKSKKGKKRKRKEDKKKVSRKEDYVKKESSRTKKRKIKKSRHDDGVQSKESRRKETKKSKKSPRG